MWSNMLPLDGDMIVKGVLNRHSTLLWYKDGDSRLDTPKEMNWMNGDGPLAVKIGSRWYYIVEASKIYAVDLGRK